MDTMGKDLEKTEEQKLQLEMMEGQYRKEMQGKVYQFGCFRDWCIVRVLKVSTPEWR